MSNITHAAELREVYLFTFDSFGVTPHDVVDGVDSVTNVRFARELLGTLVGSGLVVIDDVNQEGDVWQCLKTYDEIDRDEAERIIDGFLNTQPAKENNMSTATAVKSKPAKAKEETFHACYCGCGANVPSKSFYRPGHDARHAGVIGRQIAANFTVEGFDRRELLNDLPSERLVAKAEAIAAKAIEKIEAKIAREAAKAAPEIVEGTLTVGKKERIGRRFKDGSVEFLDDKGEWKAASKSAASTFAA